MDLILKNSKTNYARGNEPSYDEVVRNQARTMAEASKPHPITPTFVLKLLVLSFVGVEIYSRWRGK